MDQHKNSKGSSNSQSSDPKQSYSYASDTTPMKSTFGDLLSSSSRPKPINSDISEDIGRKLKETYKKTGYIDLTESDDLKNINYIFKTKEQAETKGPLSKKQTTLDSILQASKSKGRPYLTNSQQMPQRVLPSSFQTKKMLKAEKEESALSDLKKWKKQNLDSKLPQKREADDQVDEIIKKRETKSIEEQNNEVLKTFNHTTYNVNDFIKQQEKERLAALQKEKERASAEELNLKQKKYREKMEQMKSLPIALSETEELILEREKKIRESFQDSTFEFFNYLLNVNLFASDQPAGFSSIPQNFKHGGEYIKYFMPAFFEEVKGEILSAVNQNNMSNYWVITLGLSCSKDSNAEYFNFEDAIMSRRFSGNVHTDDLLMLIKDEDSNCVFQQNFSKWNSKPIHFLAFVEKLKKNNQIVFRVTGNAIDYFFDGVSLNHRVKAKVFIIDSCTTLLREFKMIRTSEFVQLNNYIYEPSKRPIYDVNPEGKQLKKTLLKFYNEPQVEAILETYRLCQGIYLLQGPPGTGKTHTIRGILSALNMKKKNARILVCAPSNSAIDEIAKRVATEKLFDVNGSRIEDIKLVRIFSQSLNLFDIREAKKPDKKEMPEEVHSISLGVQVNSMLNQSESVFELQNIKKTKDDLNKLDDMIQEYLKNQGDTLKIKELQEKKFQLTMISYQQKSSNKLALDKLKEIEQNIIRNSTVVFTTLSGSSSKEIDLIHREFDYVIIDEACQSVELSSLIPFKYNSRVVILVGDPCQLPATTFSQISNRNNYSRSLFERLMHGGCRVKMLEIQYRMIQEICSFPSHYYYKNRLATHKSITTDLIPNWISIPGILMINLLSSRESKNDAETSLSNTPECEFIGKIFAHYKSLHGTNLNIGIITPYKKQVRIIKEYMQKFYPDKWKKDVEINTIDGFQGREKDLIIFSAVRSGNSIGFLSDVRRVNVAITRARFGLWIVGSRSCLDKNICWKNFIEFCESNGKVINCKDFNEISEKFCVNEKKHGLKSAGLLQTPIYTSDFFQPENYLNTINESSINNKEARSIVSKNNQESFHETYFEKYQLNNFSEEKLPTGKTLEPLISTPPQIEINSRSTTKQSREAPKPSLNPKSTNDHSKLFLDIISRGK